MEYKFCPLVSIIIPVFNGENYISFAINSALSQSYKNIEILVVDDGSSDGTENICKSFGERIIYFKKSNGGVSSALNLGIREMKGLYFSWLSHDDYYLVDKIMTQVKYLNSLEDHENVILYSNYKIEYVEFDEIREVKLKEHPYNLFKCRLALDNDLNGCTFLVPKLAFETLGGFDENLRATQDYAMWLKLLEKYKYIFMPEFLVVNRVHKMQVGARLKSTVLIEQNIFRTKILNEISDSEISAYHNTSYRKAMAILIEKSIYQGKYYVSFYTIRRFIHYAKSRGIYCFFTHIYIAASCILEGLIKKLVAKF